MTAGIMIYNNKKQVLINSNYKNNALISTIDISNITQQEITFGNKPIIIVEELLSVNQKMADVGLKYDNGIYKLNVNNPKKSAQKIFIFGEPNNENVTTRAALIIYKKGTNEVAFDSRLKYLQIVGELTNDMLIDTNKTYGIIRRVPSANNWVMYNYRRSGGKYYYREQEWHEDYGIDANKVKIFDRYTKNIDSFFVDRPAPSMNVRYNPSYKPLLVDLSTIVSK